MKRSWLLATVCLFATAPPVASAGDIQRNPPPQETLQLVLDRIHMHAASDAWKEAGWTDAVIEGWLEKLLQQLSEATGKEHKLPLRLKDVKPQGDGNALIRGGLHIGKNVKQSSAQDSIILADGNAELSIVRNSIVIARGIVTISSAENSLIIAGRYFRCSSTNERNALNARNAPNPVNPVGSILLTRGYGEITFARGTTICAPLGIEMSSAENVTLVNSKLTRALDQQNLRIINSKPLPLGEPPVSPLEKQLELIGYVSAPRGVLFRFQGRRLFAEMGQPIVDERAEAVKELAGWTLSQSSARMAVFSSGENEACVFKAR